FNLNEWTQSVSFTFALDAEFSIYRIGIPIEEIPQSGDTKVTMEAVPSDLIRLIIDLSSRMDEPLSSGDLSKHCPKDMKEKISACNDELELTATRQGMKDFSVLFGEVITEIIHESGNELESKEGIDKMDLSGFEIKTEISGIEAPDETVSDDEPITLKMSVPKVTFTIALDIDTEKIQNQDPSGLGLSVVADALTSSFLQPMQWAANTLTTGLSNSIVSMSGLTYPGEGQESITIGPIQQNTSVPESSGVPLEDLHLTGPVSFTLPRGIQIKDWSSTSGDLKITEEGGRQTVTYIVPPGSIDDEISFRLHVTWMYFLIQFWIYPTIVIILLVLFIRRRRRKKKGKKDKMKRRQDNINKAQLGDHEFSDLVGFSSPGLSRGESIEDMASVDEY
ncbi:MAG TPA: hypothetical protein QGI72_02960, partial [Poseidonia sp.]|nr:hypothetical protein [Poseidonia sp.]